MKFIFKNTTSDGIFKALEHLGVSVRTARRLQGAVFRTGGIPVSMPEISPRILDAVRENSDIPHLTLIEKQVSREDGFAKYLFGSGGVRFESVRIPLENRSDGTQYVVCVSSQVGCAMSCAFCRTGRMGFVRNLETWEMVDQVLKIRDDSGFPVRGVVFMGMGEPLLNYEPVREAVRILNEPNGGALAAESITISTSGIIPGIRRLIEDGLQCRLVVSLSSAFHDRRSQLMPVENTYSIAELAEVLKEYHAAVKRRVTLAWTMISGLNTSEDEARELARITKGIPVKIDLIDVNDPDGVYLPPDDAERNAFRDHLTRHLGQPVARRYSGGKDINAACGLLAGNTCGVNAPEFLRKI